MPDLIEKAASLVAVVSVSLHEGALADVVESELASHPWLEVIRLGDDVVARTVGGGRSRLIIAGHLDTVPPSGNAGPTLDGSTLYGLGSVDMKGGLAVMLQLAAGLPEPRTELTFVFYAAEEIEREHNGLLHISRERPGLLKADAAVLAEPTGSVIEAGCQGVLRMELTLVGKRAHTARPWTGTNAIHRGGPILSMLGSYVSRKPVLDECEYREALQAVGVSGGVAGNVVPDELKLLLNYRFAPDLDASGAEDALRDTLGPLMKPSLGDTLKVVESAPGAMPGLHHPLLSELVAATNRAPRAKLGWTDVAFFSELGIPAANFGPGDPELAHTPAEHVSSEQLERAYGALFQVLSPT